MNASAITPAEVAVALLRAGCPSPTPAEVRRAIDTMGADCAIHDVMQSMPPGVEELKTRRMIVREKLAAKHTKEERRDIVAELERLDAEIARASVGRRGDA